jgi:hypothetical protein
VHAFKAYRKLDRRRVCLCADGLRKGGWNVAVGWSERLCENSDQAILEHEKEVRITLGKNKNTV